MYYGFCIFVSFISTGYLLLFQSRDVAYYLMSGHTAEGVYKTDGPWDLFIDISGVQELAEHEVWLASVCFVWD